MESVCFLLIIVVICLIVSAFYSAAETSITGVSDAAIHKLKSDGNRKAKIVEELKKDRENLIATILIANNALNICASSIAAAVSLVLFGDEGLLIATIVMTLAIILFSEVLPKTYAIENTEKVSLEVAIFLKYTVILLKPITIFIKFCVNILYRIFRIKPRAKDTILTAIDELRGTIELHHSEGRVIRADKEMLGSILDLSVIEVKSIMVHRKNIVSINADLPIHDIINQILECAHTRIPLWQGNPENIVGILHIKDMLKAIKTFEDNIEHLKILDIAIKPWFVPENTNLKSQLAEFSIRRSHLAIVIDEYGALEGLITLGDIMEEIVGRINDEHNEIDDIKIIDNYICEIKGSVTIRDLNRVMDWHLPDNEANTIAGLLINSLERIPEPGEEFTLHDTRFNVLEKTGNQIIRLHLANVGKQV